MTRPTGKRTHHSEVTRLRAALDVAALALLEAHNAVPFDGAAWGSAQSEERAAVLAYARAMRKADR